MNIQKKPSVTPKPKPKPSVTPMPKDESPKDQDPRDQDSRSDFVGFRFSWGNIQLQFVVRQLRKPTIWFVLAIALIAASLVFMFVISRQMGS